MSEVKSWSAKGPFISDVCKFSLFLTPLSIGNILLLSVGKFNQFLTPPKNCRLLKWMVPKMNSRAMLALQDMQQTKVIYAK